MRRNSVQGHFLWGLSPRAGVNHGKRGVTAETAILLSEALNTSPELWMGLQSDHDLWHALRKRAEARAKPQRSKVRGRHQAT